jgi:glucose-1-phosphate thymidylyltransferase
VRAVVLAAGFGTRLGALGAERPKGLLEVAGIPAIEFAVRAAEAVPFVSGIDVVTNARFHAAFAAWAAARTSAKPLRLWNDGATHAAARLGAIGDLRWWRSAAHPQEGILVLAADNVFDFALAPLAECARREPVVVLCDVGTHERVSRLASVELDAEHRVVRLVEKDPAPKDTLAVVALYGLPRSALPDLDAYAAEGGKPDNLGYFAEWLHRRRTLRGLVMPGRFADIGTPEDHRHAQELFSGGRGAPATRR